VNRIFRNERGTSDLLLQRFLTMKKISTPSRRQNFSRSKPFFNYVSKLSCMEPGC